MITTRQHLLQHSLPMQASQGKQGNKLRPIIYLMLNYHALCKSAYIITPVIKNARLKTPPRMGYNVAVFGCLYNPIGLLVACVVVRW